MTQEEIKGQLIEKRQAFISLLAKNKLTVKTVLNSQQLLVWKQLEQLLGVAEAPQDIKLPTFEAGLVQWRQLLHKDFQKLANDYGGVNVDVAKFKKYLADWTFTIPINKALKVEWVNLLSQIKEAKITGKELFQYFVDNKGAYWNLFKDSKKVKQHYKKNRKFYKRLETDKNTLTTKDLPQKQLFIDALKSAVDPSDPALPNNKKDQNKQLAVIKSKYEEQLKSWHQFETSQLDSLKPDELEDGITCSCLDPKSSEVSYNIITKENKESLLQAVKDACIKEAGKSDVLVWHDAASCAKTAIDKYKNYLTENESWKNYSLKEVEVINFPTNIGRWMMNCNTAGLNDKREFRLKLKLVFKELLKLSLSYTKKYGPKFEFNIDELILKMKNEFKLADNINLDSLIDLDSIYKDVDNRVITTMNFHNKLEQKITNITDNSIDDYYNITINQNLSTSVTIEALLQQLVQVNTKLNNTITVILNKKKASEAPVVKSIGKELGFSGFGGELELGVNWNSLFSANLSIQDNAKGLVIYVLQPHLKHVGGTRMHSFVPECRVKQALQIKKDGSSSTVPVYIALGFEYEQSKVGVSLIKGEEREEVIKAIMGSEFGIRFIKIYSRVEAERRIRSAVPINGTIGTPIKITMTMYYKFELSVRYNTENNSLECSPLGPITCTGDGKYQGVNVPAKMFRIQEQTETIKL